MDPSHHISSSPERLTVEVGLVADLAAAQPDAITVVAGPSGLGRRLTRRLAPVLPVAGHWPAAPGTVDVGAHRVVRTTGTLAGIEQAVEHVRVTTDRPCDVVLARVGELDARRFTTRLVASAQASRPGSAAGDERLIRIWCAASDQLDVAAQGARLGFQVLWARRLANTPGNEKTPQWLAEQARTLHGPDVAVTVHDEGWLRRNRFGGVVAVGAGSAVSPNVTSIRYRGSATGPHVVLVGKGITFDSGGLSLKPATGMPLMKTDMSGAAAVLATVATVRELRLPVRVTGLIACAENMPSGSAMRPGDVIRHVGGRTTEVRNTDAEGRLVLADCLAHAARRLAPDYLVDLATLTGAATVGLGRQHAALYTEDPGLAGFLDNAGARSGDRVWRMPLVPDYRAAIASDVADAANANTDPHTSAGSVTAALFLQPFAGGTRWAHLDIAGPARTESDRPSCRKGATGYGVALLTYWLTALSRRWW